MATINGIVTIGDTEIPGQADVLLLNAAGTEVVASTTSDPVSGAYSFDGLPSGATFRVLVLGGGVYRSRAFGPVETEGDGGDPHWDSVVALLHFDGDFSDETGRIWTPYGGAAIDTEVAVFGSSGVFPSGTSRISTPSHEDFDFGSEDFTIEAFVYPSSLSSPDQYILARGDTSWPFVLRYNPSNIAALVETTSGSRFVTTFDASLGVFSHIALVRRGNLLRIFVNGASHGSWVTDIGSASLKASSQPLHVGGLPGGQGLRGGRIDDLRITKGVARYTENFDPPTAPFPNF